MFAGSRHRTGADLRGGDYNNLFNTMFANKYGDVLGQLRKNAKAGGFKEQIPSGFKAGSLKQFDPQQMELYKRLFGALGPESFLSQLAGGDEGAFAQMEAPAMRQFSGLLGNIASRYSQGGGPGGLSARRSSGFQNENTAAASNFAQELQAQRQQLQMNAINEMQRLGHALLSERPYERGLFAKPQKQGGGWENVLKTGIGGLTGGAAGFFAAGGPWGIAPGAMTGMQAAHNIGTY